MPLREEPLIRQGPSACRAHVAAIGICILLGLFTWWVFRPAILDSDGFQQYQQARFRAYHDWFPPLMAITLRASMTLAHGLSTVTLLQSVLGCLGTYLAGRAMLRYLFLNRLTDAQYCWLALLIFLILFLPISPLLYYVAEFRSDSWGVILFVWLVALSLRLDDQFTSWNWPRRGLYVAAIVLLCLTILKVRHNALALLPVFCLVIYRLLCRSSRTAAVLCILVLLLVHPLTTRYLYARFNVQHWHAEDQIIALDLVGICCEDEGAREVLPLTSQSLVDDKFRAGYIPGNVGPLFEWFPYHIVKHEDGYTHGNHAQLFHEYRAAIREYPGTLVKVKVKAFITNLFHNSPRWHSVGICQNDAHLVPNRRGRHVRDLLAVIDQSVCADPALRLIFARHVVWMGLCLASTGLLFLLYCWSWNPRFLFLFSVMLLPAGYYLSYLPASAAPDYRYMYPATLIMQLFLLALLSGWGLQKLLQLAQSHEPQGER